MATLSSALRMIVGLSFPSSAFFNSISIYCGLIFSLFTKYSRFLLMLTDTFWVLVDLPLPLGNNRSRAFGELAVSIKNMSNKKTMSVIDAMLKSGLTLFLPFNFTLYHFYELCLYPNLMGLFEPADRLPLLSWTIEL